MPAPRCLILAGPNGSGKSSIYQRLLPPGEFVNADVIEAGLSEHMPSAAKKIRAGKLAISRLNELIETKTDFVFETTLSSQHALRTMTSARTAGYHVGLIFVALDTPERNIKRVRFRVKLGGHDIPDADIVRRYDAAFRNLPAAIRIAHETIVIDNSGEEPEVLFEVNLGELQQPGLQGFRPAGIEDENFSSKLLSLVLEELGDK